MLFNGTMRALSPLPRLTRALPERGCKATSDHVRLMSSSTRSPVFKSVVTMASAIGPAHSASRRSRCRSIAVKPWGANGWLAIGFSLTVGSVLRRSVSGPPIEALQGRQGGIHRCRLLSLGQSSAVLAQIVTRRIDESGAVLLAQPDSEATEVAKVEPRRPGGDLLLSKKGQKGSYHIIGGTHEGLWRVG